jgi:C-terminal processing protease CtpA/Prc
MSSHPGRVPHFNLGGYQFDSLPVLLSQTEAGPLSPSAIAGIIGNRIWRRFNTVYDYGRDRIYLEPNEFFDDPFSIDCSGLSVTSTTGGTVVIRQVLEGSPSAKAGVMPDDEIISINGSSVADYSLSDIRRLLTQDSQIVNLTLKRNGTVKELSFRLRQLY